MKYSNAIGAEKKLEDCISVCNSLALSSSQNQKCINKCQESYVLNSGKSQDAGGILSGSADVINAITGLFGTFAAAKQGTTYMPTGDSFDPNTFALTVDPEEERKRKTKNTIIISGIGLGLVITIIYFATRTKQTKVD